MFSNSDTHINHPIIKNGIIITVKLQANQAHHITKDETHINNIASIHQANIHQNINLNKVFILNIK